jgi:hypothetical protein
MPKGSEKAPVGSKPRPGGVGIGVASKSEPYEPDTWGRLLGVSKDDLWTWNHLRFIGLAMMGFLFVGLFFLGNSGTDGCSESDYEDK